MINLRDGLVAEYLFDGNAKDSSSNGFHGQIEGVAVLTSDRFGRPDCAYAFNGKDAYIEISPPPVLNSDAFSISVWVQYHEEASLAWWNNAIISQDDGGKNKESSRRVFQLSTLSKKITWHRMKLATDVVAKTPLQRGVWYHIAAVFDGSFHKLYINGVLNDTQAGTLSPHSEEPIYIGKKNTKEARFLFHGVIDDIRMYNRVLLEQEIMALYSENGYIGVSDINTELQDPEAEKALEVKLDSREFNILGIRHSGLFSEYATIIPEAIPTLRNRMKEIPERTDTEVILYEPKRGDDHVEGYFYTGYLVKETVTDIPEGMEYFHLSGQYASICGNESQMGELYNFLDGWIRENRYQKDWPDPFILEIYDHVNTSDVEICMRILNRN